MYIEFKSRQLIIHSTLKMRDRFDAVVQLQQRFMIGPYDKRFPEEEVPEVLTELGNIGILTLNG